MENEKIIKETNSEFLAGRIHWWDKVNSDSDLPADKFLAEKTGAQMPSLGRGLLAPLEVGYFTISTTPGITWYNLVHIIMSGAKSGREV